MSMGRIDFSGFEEMQRRLQNADAEIEAFIKSCAKEIAARLLRKAIQRTPVGVYPSGSGKTGGTLRRGWSAQQNQGLNVTRNGGVYTVEIINPVPYASYVEYGHRTRGGRGWVEGRFMLTISEQEIENITPALLERRVQEELGELFR